MLGRHLCRMRNAPGLLVITLAAPVTLLLFFGYVFGSAVTVPGGDYREYLVPGLFVSIAANGIVTGMITTAQDARHGVMDRFRTLPMSRAAVPLGQAAAEALIAAVGLVPLLLAGLAVGWRVHSGPAEAAGGFALLLLFRLATAWIGQYLGLLVGDEQAAGQLSSTTFVLSLVSNTYVPTAGMPTWLRAVAEWNPISAVVSATRELFGNAGAGPAAAPGSAWPIAHPVIAAVGWSLLLMAVFAPLTVRRYARRTG
ncbi:ABC transporter permease [Streptomyces sp. URMC 123]|uniref:ABC transporter permease n=1 Tax=Streptomyces sp. URMC 123 TaxID=3423403 RepID=UPI003F1C1329